MSENIENLNKQIASFMLLSLALSVPVSVQAFAGDNELLADASVNMPAVVNEAQFHILKYAAPQMPIKPDPIVEHPIISMYSVPAPPAISMYAVPENPIIKVPSQIFPIIEQEPAIKIDTPQNKPILNESSINMNNINKLNHQPNIPNNLNKINSVNITTVNTVNMNVKTDGFVPTQFGNVRIIEPYAHFVFK